MRIDEREIGKVRDLRALGGAYAQQAFRDQFPASRPPKVDTTSRPRPRRRAR